MGQRHYVFEFSVCLSICPIVCMCAYIDACSDTDVLWLSCRRLLVFSLVSVQNLISCAVPILFWLRAQMSVTTKNRWYSRNGCCDNFTQCSNGFFKAGQPSAVHWFGRESSCGNGWQCHCCLLLLFTSPSVVAYVSTVLDTTVRFPRLFK